MARTKEVSPARAARLARAAAVRAFRRLNIKKVRRAPFKLPCVWCGAEKVPTKVITGKLRFCLVCWKAMPVRQRRELREFAK